jgi:hypothetical protein
VLATCEARSHCGSVDAARCRADRDDRACAETPEEARACVLALNPILAETCVALPGALPCPADLLTSGLYDACVNDAECAPSPPGLLCLSGLCSLPCDDVEAACPDEGACATAAGRCEADCDDVLQPCASDRRCLDRRCVACDDLCTDTTCAEGTTCTCGECLPTPCEQDADCPADFGCVDFACAPCLRGDDGACLPCFSDFDCDVGVCAVGGFCV